MRWLRNSLGDADMEPSIRPVRLKGVTPASLRSVTSRWLVIPVFVALAAACGTGDSGGGPPATEGPPADQPMSVAEILKQAPEGPVTVEGFLFFTSEGPLLADLLLESYPPQPGGATLPVVGVEQEAYPTQEAGAIAWTERVVEVVGSLDNQVLYVAPGDL